MHKSLIDRVAHFSKTLSSLRHVLVMCAFHSLPSCRFISYLFSVTNFSVIDDFGEDQIKLLRFCSLESIVWLLGQSDSSDDEHINHFSANRGAVTPTRRTTPLTVQVRPSLVIASKGVDTTRTLRQCSQCQSGTTTTRPTHRFPVKHVLQALLHDLKVSSRNVGEARTVSKIKSAVQSLRN